MNLLIEKKKKSEALKFLPKLNSELMKIAKTGIIKKQNASRNVSRITKKFLLFSFTPQVVKLIQPFELHNLYKKFFTTQYLDLVNN